MFNFSCSWKQALQKITRPLLYKPQIVRTALCMNASDALVDSVTPLQSVTSQVRPYAGCSGGRDSRYSPNSGASSSLNELESPSATYLAAGRDQAVHAGPGGSQGTGPQRGAGRAGSGAGRERGFFEHSACLCAESSRTNPWDQFVYDRRTQICVHGAFTHGSKRICVRY